MNFLIVGAGISGATIARVLAEAGANVRVLETEAHPGGNCHTARDAETGIMVHHHGPHIFHSYNPAVWDFVERFADFMPYRHKVVASHDGQHFQIPINLDTINAFFKDQMDSAEAEAFIASRRVVLDHEPRNFEEAALATIGPELYGAFFRGYTRKQWGRAPTDLPAKVFARLPVRFNHDDNYFHHARIAIPREGYTAMTQAMLDHPGIDVQYGCDAAAFRAEAGFDHTIYTGPLDAYFDHAHGRLAYRTLDFRHERQRGTALPATSVNYPGEDVPQTRITEHKWFAPWESHDETIISYEIPREAGPGDRLYYPVNLADGSSTLSDYVSAARGTSGVSFVGRLATFKYIDMDVAIGLALSAADRIVKHAANGAQIPAFLNGEFEG
ncbi:UDP-galactopyranose mutase [Tepidamorphus sp. 3E244]|uniref:UDP-galactopyranose/dTDP-fucopyranose mutase family protein n=1 Tax=Tepidamorphus sp. 3E244 TaxID=3385498 RepID=UPI0038FC0A61